MRNLKRVLSLTLATAMLFGMMVMGASAADKKAADLTDMDKVTNKAAVSLLADLGIIVGKPDGSYAPTEVVNRATMAKLITFIMMGDVDPASFAGTTTDLKDVNGHWAEGYIKYCYANGYITGDGAGSFFPDQAVTAVQAAKMLLVALGYDAKDRGYEGDSNWSINIMKDAQKMDLLTNLTAKASGELTRDNAALLIYNTLFAQTVECDYSRDINGNKYVSKVTVSTAATDKLGYVTYGLTAVTGTLVANEFAALDSTKAAKGEAKVKVVTTVSGVDTTDVKNVKLASTIDQLGHQVVYYTDKAGKLISSAVAETGKTTVKTDSKPDTVAKFAKDNDLTITGANYSTNYGATATTTPFSAPVAGETVLYINTNGTGAVEYIVKTQYTFSQVTAVNESKGTINILGLGTRNIKDITGAAGLAKDDYVLFVQTGSTILVEKAKSVTGTVSSISGDQTKATIDGTSYKVGADNCEGSAQTGTPANDYIGTLFSNIKDAKAGTFYLDKAGAIVLYVGEQTVESKYALLTGLKVSADEWDSTKQAVEGKLVLADGTQVTGKIVDVKPTVANDSIYDAAIDANTYTGTTPANKFNSIVGKVYAYTVNGDGEYTITTTYTPCNSGTNTIGVATAATTAKSSLEYKSGAPKIASDVFVNANTTVLYYKIVDNKPVVTSYTGIENLPSMTVSTSMEVVMQAAPNATFASFIYVNAEAAKSQSDAQYAYIFTDKYSATANGNVYKVVVDGEIVELTLKSLPSDFAKNNVYTYTTDTDGVSKLGGTKLSTAAGVITTVGTDYIITSDAIALGDYTVDDLTSFDDDGNLVPSVGAFAKGDSIVYTTQNIGGANKIVKAYIVPDAVVDSATISPTGDQVANVELTATAVGAYGGKVSYQWHKSTSTGFTPADGTKIADATDSTFTTTTAAGATEYYVCVITVTSQLNSAEVDTANTAQVKVTVPST